MVPTQTEFAHALAQPYNVIHSILKRRKGLPQTAAEPTDADVVTHFRSLFSDRDRTAKIPALTPDTLPALLRHAQTAEQTETKLVRWRCMIQDTGFATEVYQSYQLDADRLNADPVLSAPTPSSSSDNSSSALYSSFGLDFSVELPPHIEDGNGGAADDTTDASGSSSGLSAAAKARAQRRRETESLRERSVMYAVSVPGETAWARRAYGDANVREAAFEHGEDDVSSALSSLSLSSNSRSSQQAGPSAASTSGAANPFSYKSPIPEERHVAGLLKFYDVDDVSNALQVTNVIEAVGILEASPFRTDDWQDLGFGGPSSAPSSASSNTYHGPCLHVLFYTPLPPSTIPQALTEARTPSLTGLASSSAVRAGLVAYLASALGGDELAAEFLLLALLARVHSRRGAAEGAGAESGADGGGAGIGGLSLNLSHVPERAAATASTSSTTEKTGARVAAPSVPLPKLQRALRTLVPALVHQPLSLAHLNAPEVTLGPRAGSNPSAGLDSGESLQAGRLQLPRGTLVLVDELGMGDGGTLNAGGVRNVQALAGVLRTHRLEYEYPYNRFSFEADLRVVVLSAGKSFLPVDVHVPLEVAGPRGDGPEQDVAEGTDAQAGTAAGEEPPADMLRLYRLLLLQARYAPFSIDEQDGVAERISADFVDARKRAAGAAAAAKTKGGAAASGSADGGEGMATQEDLLRRISIARLLALSRSEAKLSIDTWIRAGELDEARLARIRALPLGRPL